jgi:hypothetical protein
MNAVARRTHHTYMHTQYMEQVLNIAWRKAHRQVAADSRGGCCELEPIVLLSDHFIFAFNQNHVCDFTRPTAQQPHSLGRRKQCKEAAITTRKTIMDII